MASPHRPAWETALVVRVPALDELVARARERFDLPRKRNGIPPHVTLIVPFLPRAELDEPVLARLRALFAAEAPWGVRFSSTGRFPGVLYLAPEPASAFIALSEQLTARWPEASPYAGEHREVVPHLTVGSRGGGARFGAAARWLSQQLPIATTVAAAQLYRFDGIRWSESEAFRFAGGRPPVEPTR